MALFSIIKNHIKWFVVLYIVIFFPRWKEIYITCKHFYYLQTEWSIFAEFNLPIFLAKFDVTYTIDGALAATCLAAFKQSLADTNTTISSNIDYFCRLLDPGLFIIESLDSSSLTFKVKQISQEGCFTWKSLSFITFEIFF